MVSKSKKCKSHEKKESKSHERKESRKQEMLEHVNAAHLTLSKIVSKKGK